MKNNYKDYAWNEFEKNSYLNGEIKIPAKYKIKIDDDLEKRIELELILENATGHMRGHAIVSSDYAIKVINLKYTNNYNIVINERNIQIELAKSFLLKAEDYIDI